MVNFSFLKHIIFEFIDIFLIFCNMTMRLIVVCVLLNYMKLSMDMIVNSWIINLLVLTWIVSPVIRYVVYMFKGVYN